MTRYEKFSSRVVVLAVDNIDTDQIIPARFLKTTSKVGLGELLFHDWRYEEDGSPLRDFALNRPDSAGAQILLAGDNFGCGSSREHAPWALAQFGFRAVISTSFADIFRQNALKNSLLPIVIPREEHAALLELLAANSSVELSVDLAGQRLVLPGGRAISFPIDPFSKHCLLDGVDELGYILAQESAIASYEARIG